MKPSLVCVAQGTTCAVQGDAGTQNHGYSRVCSAKAVTVRDAWGPSVRVWFRINFLVMIFSETFCCFQMFQSLGIQLLGGL